VKKANALAALPVVMALPSVLSAAITITNGGSLLSDFKVLDVWNTSKDGVGGNYRNVSSLAIGKESGQSVLYASVRDIGLTRLTMATPAPGYTYYGFTNDGTNTDDVRGGGYAGLFNDPNYNSGTLIATPTFLPGGVKGFVGGTDDDRMTTETGDTPLQATGATSGYSNLHAGSTFVPAAYTWTGTDAYFIIRPYNSQGGNAIIRQFELDTTPDPDNLTESLLPGRTDAAYLRSEVYDLAAEIGQTGLSGIEFAEYGSGKGALYLFSTASTNDPSVIPGASNANRLLTETYAIIVITPGPDGKFGRDGSGVLDDEAIGYTLGEPGAGNTGKVEKQHIESESAPGDTTLMDLDGDYGAGFPAVAFDPVTRYFYLHSGGDYARGMIMVDTSSRVPEPATLGLLGLGFLPLVLRRRK
jgi:hypothetical protein